MGVREIKARMIPRAANMFGNACSGRRVLQDQSKDKKLALHVDNASESPVFFFLEIIPSFLLYRAAFAVTIIYE